MDGMDLNDQLRGYYMTGRKSKKWWCCLRWFLVNICTLNAHILERLSRHNRNRTPVAFCLDLGNNLTGDFSARKLSASSVRIKGGHWPISYSKGRCKRCLKQKVTWCRMACELCDKRICLDCFRNHTTEDIL